ncbi:RES family NAD+ phosphorylase [Streptomyces sp. S.PB5]|uniref:RES family NAD+ phosphorylase n=1 Tax=Streptomyces sp. S.PB5 TaxID=3020844 RepID=UPI00339D70A1
MSEHVFFDLRSSVRVAVPLRRETGDYWRHCDREYNPMPTLDVAPAAGRYHTLGGAPVWYGADSIEGAWAEYSKHFPIGVLPMRYLAHVHVRDVAVVDLIDQITLDRLGYSRQQLTMSDYRSCQELGELLLGHQRVDGILAPSAAYDSGRVLILKRQSVIDSSCEVIETSRSLHNLSGRGYGRDAA